MTDDGKMMKGREGRSRSEVSDVFSREASPERNGTLLQEPDFTNKIEREKFVKIWTQGYNIPEDQDGMPITKWDFARLICAVHRTKVGEDGWQQLSHFKNCEVWKKPDPKSGVTLVKAYSYFPGIKKELIFRMIMDTELRLQWDPVFSEMRIPHRFDDNQDVLYFAIKAPPGITDRDFLQYRSFKFNSRPGVDLIVYKQAPDIYVDKKKNYIRALTLAAGYILTEDPNDPNSCFLRIVSQNDVKGFIPKPIVNFFASKMPNEWYDKLFVNAQRIKNKEADEALRRSQSMSILAGDSSRGEFSEGDKKYAADN